VRCSASAHSGRGVGRSFCEVGTAHNTGAHFKEALLENPPHVVHGQGKEFAIDINVFHAYDSFMYYTLPNNQTAVGIDRFMH
jgi:hypothetical protein